MQKRVEELEAQLSQKNEVIAEVMEAYVRCKKTVGCSEGVLGEAGDPRCRGGIHGLLGGTHGDPDQAAAERAGAIEGEVSRLEGPVWER
jgi:hypothetical protein